MSNSLAISWTVARQAHLSMEFSRQEYWSGLPFPSPGDLPNAGSNLRLPDWQADSLPLSYREAQIEVHNQFSSVQSFSRVPLFVTLWTAACQTSLSIINSQSLLKLLSIELVMPSNHLILCRTLLLLLLIVPSTRVFPNESVLCIRWPKYWSFNFSISPFSEYSGLISFRMEWLDLLAVQGTFKSLLQQFKSIDFFGAQLSS